MRPMTGADIMVGTEVRKSPTSTTTYVVTHLGPGGTFHLKTAGTDLHRKDRRVWTVLGLWVAA